jgi:hypothetical protein
MNDPSLPKNGTGAADTTPNSENELSDSIGITNQFARPDREIARFSKRSWEKLVRGYLTWFNSEQLPIAEATLAQWSRDFLRHREGQLN